MAAGLDLEVVDVDGALRETAAEAVDSLDGDTRADFFKKAGLAGGAAIGGGALLGALIPEMAAAGTGRPPRRFGRGDIGILNYALTLEYLEAAFYNEATKNNRRNKFIKDKQIGQLLKRVTLDENTHVKFLKGQLGGKAVARPKFEFGKTTKSQKAFIDTTYVLENTGVHAYLGQVTNIESPVVAKAAASILTVEARHASVAGLLSREQSSAISPNGAFDTGFKAGRILKAVGKTGFIRS